MDVVFVFYNDGSAIGLPLKADDFGMTDFAVNDDLRFGVVGVGLMDFLLKFENYRASGIDDCDVVAACNFVGARRFAMRTKKNADIVEVLELVVLDGDEAEASESVDFLPIVDYVAKAI